ncbi:MAG: N-acetylglucosamine-6-phosphate deacetylase [Clostridia bacterium]|nr:N-acetylglucosamine-6-phosphate deacetylase [Clostridia bacterium]
MKILAQKVLLPHGWAANQVITVENDVIVSVESGKAGDVVCTTLTPGLFDVHTHGGMGYYVTDLREEMQQKYLDDMLRHGVTDILLGTGSYADYNGILSLCRKTMERQKNGEAGGARIRGVHLEGPFLNPKKCGAMDPKKMPVPSVQNFAERFSAYEDMVKLVTVAAEVEGAHDLIRELLGKGLKVQLGHTCATYEEAQAAFDLGVTSQCHTFNAAPAINHRAPGAVTAALNDDRVYCEAICDFVHLHPGTVKMIYKMKGPEKMMLISDSSGTAGLPDGVYHMLEKDYEVRDGGCYLEGTNTLSGACVYTDHGVRNVIDLGIPSEHAFRMASRTPAERIGLDRLGCIAPGFEAHLAAWTEDYKCAFTVVNDQINRA